jgi:hypothetical protein
MSSVIITVRVEINDFQHDKLNTKRRRLGRQEVSAYDAVENTVVTALQHSLEFDAVEVVKPDR